MMIGYNEHNFNINNIQYKKNINNIKLLYNDGFIKVIGLIFRLQSYELSRYRDTIYIKLKDPKQKELLHSIDEKIRKDFRNYYSFITNGSISMKTHTDIHKEENNDIYILISNVVLKDDIYRVHIHNI
jgi:hypothetical protein